MGGGEGIMDTVRRDGGEVSVRRYKWETVGKDIGIGLEQEMLTLALWIRGASELGITRGKLETRTSIVKGYVR